MKRELTPLDFLARSAFVYRDKVGVVDGERRFTYCEFNERVHRLASALQRVGIEPGDRVAVLAPNTIAALEPHFETRLYEALGFPSRSDPSPRFLERTAAEWESWARERDLPIFAVEDIGR